MYTRACGARACTTPVDPSSVRSEVPRPPRVLQCASSGAFSPKHFDVRRFLWLVEWKRAQILRAKWPLIRLNIWAFLKGLPSWASTWRNVLLMAHTWPCESLLSVDWGHKITFLNSSSSLSSSSSSSFSYCSCWTVSMAASRPHSWSSISAGPDSKSVSAAEKVTVEGSKGKQLTCRGPSGCSTAIELCNTAVDFSLSLSSSPPIPHCFAFSQHWDAARIARLETTRTNYLSMATPLLSFPASPSPAPSPSGNQLPSFLSLLHCSCVLSSLPSLHVLWPQSPVRPRWWTDVLLPPPLPRVQHHGWRQASKTSAGIPSVMWARSTERGWCQRPLDLWFQQQGKLLFSFPLFIFYFLERRSPCVPFHGCVWKAVTPRRTGESAAAAEWNAARLWACVEIEGVQIMETQFLVATAGGQGVPARCVVKKKNKHLSVWILDRSPGVSARIYSWISADL